MVDALVLALALGAPAAAQGLGGSLPTPRTGSRDDDSSEEGEEESSEESEEESSEGEDESDDEEDSGGKGGSSSYDERYLLPDPPALSAVGERGTRFDEPSSPADFAVAAGDFFSKSGELTAGGAVEFGLRAIGATRGLTAADYLERPLRRVLARTYLSAATGEDGDDLIGAIGARAVIVDGADPLVAAAYREAVRAARERCEVARTAAGADWVEKYTTCIEAAYAREAKGIRKSRWNAFGVVWSATGAFRFAEGALSGAGGDNAASWVSVAGPAGDRAQVGGAVGWEQSLDDDPNALFTTAVVRGGKGRARIRTEAGHELTFGKKLGSAFPVVLGGEFQIDDEVWIATSFGLTVDPTSDLVTMASEATFRWGQNSEPTFMK